MTSITTSATNFAPQRDWRAPRAALSHICHNCGGLSRRKVIMRTYSARPGDVKHGWVVFDAEGVVLGRLASAVATRLRGKHRAQFTPHMDCGDHVIVVNAEKIHLTGRKRADKTYYWHTGYPGGIRSRRAADILDGSHPERVVANAIRRMLPDGPLARRQLSKLRVYAGPDHPHTAQSPTEIDLKPVNRKNTRSE